MTLKKFIFLILTTVFISGCENEEENDLNFPSIDLMTEDNPSVFKKTIILFENNDYLIKTSLDNYISSYPFDVLSRYDDIKEQVNLDIQNLDTLLMMDYLYYPADSTYILAYHLEIGSCLIFDKNTKKIIPKIKMEEWSDGNVPLSGGGGRRFYIKNELFLETIDWIS